MSVAVLIVPFAAVSFVMNIKGFVQPVKIDSGCLR
jgi:hypothetical protein